MLKEWKTQPPETLLETRVFNVCRQVSTSPRTGEDCSFYLLDAPGWINVVPVTPAGELVLVRQYRHGVGTFTLEIPGGMMDPDDDSPAVAAARELREETGYEAGRLWEAGWVEPNPAIQGNRCHTFVAEGACLTAAPEPDGSEDIEVVLLPLAEIGAALRDGRIRHSLVISALTLVFGLGPHQTLPPGPEGT